MNQAASEGASWEALDYDSLARGNYWHPEALFGLCYEYIKPGETLLDIGAGTGMGSELFGRAGLQVHGLDCSEEMLARFRLKRTAAGLIQHDLSIRPWPYEDGSFDHAVALGVLHFFPDLEPLFQEAARLLRPGGIFAFTVKAPQGEEPLPYAVELIQGTPLYLHGRAYIDRMLALASLSPLKELHLLVRTGKGTEDPFWAFVARKA